MPFDDRLKNSQTPHRVYALCRLVQYKSLTKEGLRQYLLPPALNKSEDVFKDVYDMAEKGGLIIKDSDGTIRLNLAGQEVESVKSFRRAIAKRAFSNYQLTFSRFTAWYLMRGPKVYSDKKEELLSNFDSEININKNINMYNDTNFNGWRTWVCFLGLGFTHSGTVVPNACLRLQDMLEQEWQPGHEKPVPFREFMDWLGRHCPELDGGELSHSNRGQAQGSEQHLSLALSAGLRALHDSGKIKLKNVRDARDIWYLSEVAAHEITDAVTEITVGRW